MEEKRNIKRGYFVPDAVMRDTRLANGAKILYSVIEKRRGYYDSMPELERFLNISPDTRRKYIAQLVDRKYINATKTRDGYIELTLRRHA